jgi:Ca2+-binding RTX toxin-like protein
VNLEGIHGGNFDDTLTGNAADDELFGNDGNDTLYGRACNDSLNGGNGDDSLFGEAGLDYLDGGPGNNTLRARYRRALFGSNRRDRRGGGTIT